MKRSKYGNRRTRVGELEFDSAREARRYCELRLMQAAGEIAELELQPAFKLKVAGKLITTYRADFRYRDKSGEVVVEDAKGYRTREYMIKARLFSALHGFSVREV